MTRRTLSRGEAGLSLIELLVAMTLLAFVALGILPMMMRSLADCQRGWEATEVSHLALSNLEELSAAPFDSPALGVDPGFTEKISSRAWVEGEAHEVGDVLEGWTDKPGNKGRIVWRQNTFVRWYGLDNLAVALDGRTETTEVNLKEIRIQLVGERRGGSLGAGQELWIRMLKAF